MFRDGWKVDYYIAYNPIIIFTVFGKNDIETQLLLSIRSLIECGQYADDILVITNWLKDDLHSIFPSEFLGKLHVYNYHASDRLDYVCARLTVDQIPFLKSYQPLLYTDVDVIFDKPVNTILEDILLSAKISAQIEFDEIAARKNSTGAQLFTLDDIGTVDSLGFNAGILGIPNMRDHGQTISAIRQAITNFVKQYGREALVGADQAMANYVLLKLNMLDPNTMTKYVWIPDDVKLPTPSKKRGLVHFWPFAENRSSAMSQYLDVLLTEKQKAQN